VGPRFLAALAVLLTAAGELELGLGSVQGEAWLVSASHCPR
jgi:hypothetical protein